MVLLQLIWSAPTAPLTKECMHPASPSCSFYLSWWKLGQQCHEHELCLGKSGTGQKSSGYSPGGRNLGSNQWFPMIWNGLDAIPAPFHVWNWFGRDLDSIPRYATSLDACWLHAVEPYRRSYTCQCPAYVYAPDLAGGKVNKQIPPACCNIVSVNC
jgi:hypothetical protein